MICAKKNYQLNEWKNASPNVRSISESYKIEGENESYKIEGENGFKKLLVFRYMYMKPAFYERIFSKLFLK